MTAIALQVTRDVAAGGPTALLIEDPANGLEVIDLLEGDEQERRGELESAFVRDAVLLWEMDRTSELVLIERVKGSTMAQLITRVSALTLALRQFAFTLSGSYGGQAVSWSCNKATRSVYRGLAPVDMQLENLERHYEFTIRRTSTPIAGPF